MTATWSKIETVKLSLRSINIFTLLLVYCLLVKRTYTFESISRYATLAMTPVTMTPSRGWRSVVTADGGLAAQRLQGFENHLTQNSFGFCKSSQIAKIVGALHAIEEMLFELSPLRRLQLVEQVLLDGPELHGLLMVHHSTSP